MKKLIGVAIIVSVLFVLSGCGEKGASTEEMAGTKDAGKTENARGETTAKPKGEGSMPPVTSGPEMDDLKK